MIAAGVLVVAAIIAGLVAGSRSQPGQAMSIQGAEHIEKGAVHIPYNSTPPTSGPHWNTAGEAPASWGVYEIPLANEVQVHNLEHGGIMIQYNCSDCPELKQQIEDFYNRWVPANRIPLFPASSKIVVAPYPDMPSRIALTAWGHIDTMDSWDEARAVKFIEAFRDKGPERTP